MFRNPYGKLVTIFIVISMIKFIKRGSLEVLEDGKIFTRNEYPYNTSRMLKTEPQNVLIALE